MSSSLLDEPRLELRISLHAVLRFQERVARVAPEIARAEIRTIIAGSRSRTTPPNWMVVPDFPYSRYLISAEHPDVCPVVQDGTVVTVYSRATMWQSPPDQDPPERGCRWRVRRRTGRRI